MAMVTTMIAFMIMILKPDEETSTEWEYKRHKNSDDCALIKMIKFNKLKSCIEIQYYYMIQIIVSKQFNLYLECNIYSRVELDLKATLPIS